MHGRLGALVIYNSDRHEEHADRRQEELHGEHSSAWNTAVRVAVVVWTTAATIVRIVTWGPTAVRTAGSYFEGFSYRHTFVISHKHA
jgi:hypothetical protein